MIKLQYYYAEWCGPCHLQKPEIKEVEELWNDNDEVTIERLNLDKSEKQATKRNIRSIPTLLLLSDEEEIQRFVGVTSSQELNEAIKQHLD